MQISRLPQPLVREEGGMLKDHVIVVDELGAPPLALRVNGAFAGYIAGMLAELVSSPESVALLERRLADPRLMPETRTLMSDIVRTVRRHQAQRQPV